MKPVFNVIWPSELADFGVPVWGDRVVIPSFAKGSPLLRPYAKKDRTVIAHLPNTSNSRSLKALLAETTQIRLSLTAQCTAGPLDPKIRDQIAVRVKTALEHYRSILDYLAHYMFTLCQPCGTNKAPKVYFP